MKESLSRIVAIVALVLIIGSMVLSTVLPGLINNQPAPQPQNTAESLDPTIPPVVFPTPETGTPIINSAGAYIHPSGAFYLMQPQGWITSHNTQVDVASASMVNTASYSVVHAYIQKATFEQDLASLDTANDAAMLAATWSEYDSWTETSRELGEDRLTINFTLTLGGATYLARHYTWVDPAEPTWAVVLRFVVPGNNPALLDALADQIIPSYHLLPDALTAPLTWDAFNDQIAGYTIKLPPDWQLTDGGPGLITTYSRQGMTLTLSHDAEGTIADADEAAAWVSNLRAEAEIIGVEPVAHTLGEGFIVVYHFTDADGENQSGMAVLLSDDERGLYAAHLRIAEGEVTPSTDGSDPNAEIWQALNTFTLLPADATNPTVFE